MLDRGRRPGASNRVVGVCADGRALQFTTTSAVAQRRRWTWPRGRGDRIGSNAEKAFEMRAPARLVLLRLGSEKAHAVLQAPKLRCSSGMSRAVESTCPTSLVGDHRLQSSAAVGQLASRRQEGIGGELRRRQRFTSRRPYFPSQDDLMVGVRAV